jgi:hypothetical protein
MTGPLVNLTITIAERIRTNGSQLHNIKVSLAGACTEATFISLCSKIYVSGRSDKRLLTLFVTV